MIYTIRHMYTYIYIYEINGLMPNPLGTLRGGVMKGNLLGVAAWEDKTCRMARPAKMN